MDEWGTDDGGRRRREGGMLSRRSRFGALYDHFLGRKMIKVMGQELDH